MDGYRNMRYDWNPRREIRELQAQVEEAFRVAQQRERFARPVGAITPPLDFTATREAFYVVMDLPGVTKEEVRVQVERGALVVSGKKYEPGMTEGRLVRRERQYGGFARTIPLPEEADLGDVVAKLRRGELEVRIGRKAEAGPRRVEVAVE